MCEKSQHVYNWKTPQLRIEQRTFRPTAPKDLAFTVFVQFDVCIKWQLQHIKYSRHRPRHIGTSEPPNCHTPWPTWPGRCIWKLWQRPAAHQPGQLRCPWKDGNTCKIMKPMRSQCGANAEPMRSQCEAFVAKMGRFVLVVSCCSQVWNFEHVAN